MNRPTVLLGLLLTLPGASAFAQLKAVPAGATPVQVAGTCKSCCSIFDAMGTKQMGKFLDQNVMKSSLGQAVLSVTQPIARRLGLGPSLLSDKFAKEGGAMGLANQLKVEEKKAPLKVKAIRYLGTQDCNCNPAIVDALLAALDDCTEEVRYEALLALKNRCCGEKKKGVRNAKHKDKKASKAAHGADDMDVNCPDCECPGCQCQKVVIDRLQRLLLDRDSTGCLIERSARVRALAAQMVEECLLRMQPPPDEDVPAPKVEQGVKELEKARPKAEEPAVRPDPPPAPKPSDVPRAEAASPLTTEPAGALLAEPAGVSTSEPQEPVAPVAVSDPPAARAAAVLTRKDEAPASAPKSSRGAKPTGARRHLWGEVFGY